MPKKKPAKRNAPRRVAARSATPAAPGSVEQPPSSFTLPGRRTTLTEALAREIADKVANCASFRDACLLSGVEERTGFLWLQKGRQGLEARSDTPDLYVQFVQMIEGANGRRRTLLKLQMRRAASGTATKPGDWRAAQALGAMTDPGEFVPQVRIHVERQVDSVLDAVTEVLKDEPEKLAKVLQAVTARGAIGAVAAEEAGLPAQENPGEASGTGASSLTPPGNV